MKSHRPNEISPPTTLGLQKCIGSKIAGEKRFFGQKAKKRYGTPYFSWHIPIGLGLTVILPYRTLKSNQKWSHTGQTKFRLFFAFSPNTFLPLQAQRGVCKPDVVGDGNFLTSYLIIKRSYVGFSELFTELNYLLKPLRYSSFKFTRIVETPCIKLANHGTSRVYPSISSIKGWKIFYK